MVLRDGVKNLGFEELPNFTIMNSLSFNLGRNKSLSFGNIVTCNEMLYICETDCDNPKIITDLICLHNYDYDGFMTMSKLEDIIRVLKFNEL